MDRSNSKKNLVFNSGLTLVDKLLICILGLALRRVFVHTLGQELSGLSGLFQNIIEFLNLTTAGFATALYPRFYKYNRENNYVKINSLMKLTVQFYTIVAVVILVLGCVCSFFLETFIYDNGYALSYLQLVFMIQVLTQCARTIGTPYLTILSVREKGYIYTVTEIIVTLVVYVSQIFSILYQKNYVIYLVIALVGYILMYFMLYISSKIQFPWLQVRKVPKMEKIADLLKDIKYTVVVQIANFLFCSTDSLVISSFLGLVLVNNYGNYMTIATAVTAIFAATEGPIRIYFGNKLSIKSEKSEKEQFLKNTSFIFFVVGGIYALLYFNLIGDFVQWWLGKTYRQSLLIDGLFALYLLVFFVSRSSMEYLINFGIFKHEMKANIIAAIVNIILSLLLVNKIGIAGVLIGTIVGYILQIIQRSIYCYQEMEAKSIKYFLRICEYMGIFIIILFVDIKLCGYIQMSNIWATMILKAIVSAAVSGAIMLGVFYKTSEAKYCISNGKRIIKKIVGKIKG